jgi:hypothetical protein
LPQRSRKNTLWLRIRTHKCLSKESWAKIKSWSLSWKAQGNQTAHLSLNIKWVKTISNHLKTLQIRTCSNLNRSPIFTQVGATNFQISNQKKVYLINSPWQLSKWSINLQKLSILERQLRWI